MSQQVTISTSEQIVRVTLNESGEPVRAVLRENAIIIQKGGTRVGTVNAINFIEGTGITLTYTNDADGVTGNLTITSNLVGAGTVTSFSAGSLTPLFNSSVANSTSTPALTFAQIAKAANRIFAGPASGADANPDFRALVSSDLPLFVKSDNSTSSVTGTLSVTKLGSILIPANTFTSNDTIRLHASFNKSGTASTWSTRFYFNTSDTVTLATQIGQMTFGATTLYGSMERHLLIKTATTEEIMSVTELLVLDTQATTALASLSIDFTVDQYFLISIGLGSAADTASLRGFTVERLRS